MNQNILMLAVTGMTNKIPENKSLQERLEFIMHYIRTHKSDVMWMIGNASDDDMFRVAIATVMMKCNDEEKDIITRSLKPLQMLNAVLQGIPVDLSQVSIDEDCLPLMKIWQESKANISTQTKDGER